MLTAKVTSKGQITLPKDVRDQVGVKAGDEVEFVQDECGLIHVRRHIDVGELKKWIGFLRLKDRTTDEVMDELRGE